MATSSRKVVLKHEKLSRTAEGARAVLGHNCFDQTQKSLLSLTFVSFISWASLALTSLSRVFFVTCRAYVYFTCIKSKTLLFQLGSKVSDATEDEWSLRAFRIRRIQRDFDHMLEQLSNICTQIIALELRNRLRDEVDHPGGKKNLPDGTNRRDQKAAARRNDYSHRLEELLSSVEDDRTEDLSPLQEACLIVKRTTRIMDEIKVRMFQLRDRIAQGSTVNPKNRLPSSPIGFFDHGFYCMYLLSILGCECNFRMLFY